MNDRRLFNSQRRLHTKTNLVAVERRIEVAQANTYAVYDTQHINITALGNSAVVMFILSSILFQVVVQTQTIP